MPTPITKSNGGTTFFNGIAGGIDGKQFYGPSEHNDVINEKDIFTIGTDIGADYKQFHLPLTSQATATDLIAAFAWSMDFPNDSSSSSPPVTSPTHSLTPPHQPN